MSYTPINYSTPNDGLGDAIRDAFIKVDTMLQELYNSKVDKIGGKGLSTNDYTDDEQTKLAGIAAGAEVNVQADLAQEDESADDFVKNKDSVLSVLTSIDFGRLVAPQIDFTIPVGKTAVWLEVNFTSYYPLTANNASEFNTFSQTDNIVSLTNTAETNEYVIIFYK